MAQEIMVCLIALRRPRGDPLLDGQVPPGRCMSPASPTSPCWVDTTLADRDSCTLFSQIGNYIVVVCQSCLDGLVVAAVNSFLTRY